MVMLPPDDEDDDGAPPIATRVGVEAEEPITPLPTSPPADEGEEEEEACTTGSDPTRLREATPPLAWLELAERGRPRPTVPAPREPAAVAGGTGLGLGEADEAEKGSVGERRPLDWRAALTSLYCSSSG
jgi:hypothetical protein